MKQFFTIFVVVQVLAHSALGCCLHHEHASAEPRGDAPSTSAQACGGRLNCAGAIHHADQQQEGQREGEESHSPCGGLLQCEGESCQAILSDSISDARPSDRQVCFWQSARPMPAELKLSGAAKVALHRSLDEACGEVRAHLFFQILLI